MNTQIYLTILSKLYKFTIYKKYKKASNQQRYQFLMIRYMAKLTASAESYGSYPLPFPLLLKTFKHDVISQKV